MIGPAPETRWGKKLTYVSKKRPKGDRFNLRLTEEATDREKEEFEVYIMYQMGGDYFLKKLFPNMRDPYYTWEGKVVEKASLKGRSLRMAGE